MHCESASLSVQDLESVGGASGREGFRRTAPRCEKCVRPLRADMVAERGVVEVSETEEAEETVGAGEVQGVASS